MEADFKIRLVVQVRFRSPIAGVPRPFRSGFSIGTPGLIAAGAAIFGGAAFGQNAFEAAGRGEATGLSRLVAGSGWAGGDAALVRPAIRAADTFTFLNKEQIDTYREVAKARELEARSLAELAKINGDQAEAAKQSAIADREAANAC